MKIITDNKWKEFKFTGYNVPARVLRDFGRDPESEDDLCETWIRYRKEWFPLEEFMRGGPAPWQGLRADSFFSGTLIQISRDGELYKIARCYS